MLKNRLLASWLLFRSFPKPSLYEFSVHSDDIFEFVSLRFVATIIPERKSYGPNRRKCSQRFIALAFVSSRECVSLSTSGHMNQLLNRLISFGIDCKHYH